MGLKLIGVKTTENFLSDTSENKATLQLVEMILI